jgi:anti-sigma-K factor RskA
MKLHETGELTQLLQREKRPRWHYVAAAAAIAALATGAFLLIDRTPASHPVLAASIDALQLRVLPEFAARPERYRVQLFRMSADDSMQSVAELGGLAPDADTFVSVFVDAASMQAGQYRLTIAGDPDTDARDKESAFILRMRRAVADPSAASR